MSDKLKDASKLKWADVIGRRVLVRKRRAWGDDVTEAVVLEVSPAGRVKLKFTNDYKSWSDADDYFLIEVLQSARNKP